MPRREGEPTPETLGDLSVRALITKIENLDEDGRKIFDKLHEKQFLKSPDEIEGLNEIYQKNRTEREGCISEIEGRTSK